jgi:hypothetical protein
MANSEIQQKLFAIAHADWNAQYITADAEIKNKCCFGRIIKLLGIQNWPFVKNYFADPASTIGMAQSAILSLINNSMTEISVTAEDRSDLHTAVAQKVNLLIDHFNNKTKREKIDENTKLNLASFQKAAPAPSAVVVPISADSGAANADASENDVPAATNVEKQAEEASVLEPGEIASPSAVLSPSVSESRDEGSALDVSQDEKSVDRTESKRKSRKANAEKSTLRRAKKAEIAKSAKSEEKAAAKTDVDSSSEIQTRSKKAKNKE